MHKILVAMAVFGALTVPALAQSTGSMKCSAFTAMDSTGRMAAINSLQESMASGTMASGEMAKGAMASGNMTSGNMTSGNMASGAMASGTTASGEMAKGAMASDKTTDYRPAGGDSMMAGSDLAQKVSGYCRDHPGMMLKDAL